MSDHIFLYNILGTAALYTTCLTTFINTNHSFWRINSVIIMVVFFCYLYINRRRHPLHKSRTLLMFCKLLCFIGLSLIIYRLVY